MTMKSFDDWSKAGYKINKGAKATRVGSTNYFSPQQVTHSPRRSSFNSTFQGCSPKGTAQVWGDFEEEDEQDNPLTHNWMGMPY